MLFRDLDQQFFERKIVNIFLLVCFNICIGCPFKEPSHSDSSFEYPHYMFPLRNNKKVFRYTLLTKALVMVRFFETEGQENFTFLCSKNCCF